MSLDDGRAEEPGVINAAKRWLKHNRPLLISVPIVVIVAFVPLYGVLFPPAADLAEHILIAKLLWEKLAGVSHLDIEVSTFLGYRLLPFLIAAVISFFKLLGVSLIYLPKTIAFALIALHSVIVTSVMYFTAKQDGSQRSYVYAVIFGLPAVVVMYSACWFIGFVNFTLGISFVVLAVCLTELFLRDGKPRVGLLLFFSLFLAYAAHPFAPVFWVAWCSCRGLMSLVAGNFLAEWKRLLMLPLFFIPVFLYHYFATKGTELAPRDLAAGASPFLSFGSWYSRLGQVTDGTLLKADDASSGAFFAMFALGMVLATALLAFLWGTRRIKAVMLTTILFFVVTSFIDEKFIPTPGVHWLAYDYRFYSTVMAICLTVAAMVLVRLLPGSARSFRRTFVFVCMAAFCVAASAGHLISVWRAYARFDAPGREYAMKILNYEPPAGIYLPHSRWHPDGTFLSHYLCLEEADCNPVGTSFHNYGGDLYAIRIRSQNRIPQGPLVAHWKFDEPNSADLLTDSSGNGYTATPRGTTVVEGRINKARAFNGSSDYIDIRPIDIPDAITVAAWVYADNFQQNAYIILKNPVNKMWALLLRSDGFVRWRGVGSEQQIKCPTPENSNWHLIAATQDGTSASLFIDGSLCTSGEVEAIGNSPPSAISIGRYDTINYDYFTGRIDEVRIYDRALSASEIGELLPPPVGNIAK